MSQKGFSTSSNAAAVRVLAKVVVTSVVATILMKQSPNVSTE